MRSLILIGALLLALPALAGHHEETEAPEPAPEAAASSEAMPATEAAAAEPASEPEPMAAVAEPEPVLEPVGADAVARRTFATAIDQREPIDSVSALGNDHDRVYYFTEFVGIEGRQVTHRWEFGGEVKAEVPIAVGGPRWRAYSSKQLDSSWLGEWTVSVVDESGHVVHTDTFVYEQAAPQPEPEVAAETATPEAAPEAVESTPAETPAAPAPMEP